MPVHAMTPPAQARQSKYDYTADVQTTLDLLKGEESPGDGPFDSQGKARSAATSLLAALGDGGKEYGARVWEVEGEGFYFALKPGRKEYHGRKDRPKK